MRIKDLMNARFFLNQCLLAGGIITGFGRELVLASLFGLGNQLDLFRNASLLPVAASDTLNAAFVFAIIPHLVQAETEPPEEARKHISASLYISLFLAVVIFLAGFAFSSSISAALFSGNASPALTHASRWAWVMFLFVGVTFGLRGMYFQVGKTWLGAATPIVRSGGFIVLLIAFKPLLVDGGSYSLEVAIAALVLSGVGVLALHLVALDRKTARAWWSAIRRPAFDRSVYRSVFLALSLSLGYYALNAATRVIDQGFTSKLPTGAVSAVEFSYSITMAFGILFATAFNLTQAVNISRGIRDKSNNTKIAARVGYSIAILAGIGSLFFSHYSDSILSILLHHGRMTNSDINTVSSLFSIQSLGVMFLVSNLISAQFMIAFKRFDVLIVSLVFKVLMKYYLLYYVMLDCGIYATVYSFVVVEAGYAIVMLAFTELSIRRLTRDGATPPHAA